jgi:hypothetical protein
LDRVRDAQHQHEQLPRGAVAHAHGRDPEAERQAGQRHRDPEEHDVAIGGGFALHEPEIREPHRLDGHVLFDRTGGRGRPKVYAQAIAKSRATQRPVIVGKALNRAAVDGEHHIASPQASRLGNWIQVCGAQCERVQVKGRANVFRPVQHFVNPVAGVASRADG